MNLRHFLLPAFVLLGTAALTCFGENYGLDPVHSFAIFRIRHNNVSYTYGRINAPEGTVVYDAAKPEDSTFNITLKAANLDTNNAGRDTHVKSPSLLNAAEFPTLTFKSTAVKKGEGNNLEVTGDLTLHGVKKSVTVTLERTGQTAGAKPLVGFEGTFNIKRSDYDMKEMLDVIGDDIRIIISIEAGKK